MKKTDIKRTVLWLIILGGILAVLISGGTMAWHHFEEQRQAEEAEREREVIQWYIDNHKAPFKEYESYEEYLEDIK